MENDNIDDTTADESEELEYFQQIMNDNESKLSESDEEFGFIPAPIDHLGPPGRWIRHKLLESILYGTPVLLAIQRLRCKYVTQYMHIASILGTEEAYVVLFCFLAWIVDMRLARLISVGMAVGFYCANGVKNVFCLPRPPSPPVRPLENAYYTWGLPSHHSVLAVVCPWYIWFYCLLHYHLELTTFIVLFTLIATWSCSVLICRIYNGIHSPADVVTGSLIGCIIVAFMHRYDNIMDLSSIFNSQSALLLPVISCILLILHPYDEVGLAAFVETTSMVSAATGIILGKAYSHGRSPPLKNVMEMYKYGETPLIHTITIGFARVFLGVVLVGLTKVVFKKVAQMMIELVMKLLDIKYYTKSKTSVFYTGYNKNYRLPPIFANKNKNSEEEEEREKEKRLRMIAQQQEPWNISHAVRFATYIGVGFNAYYTHSALCQHLRLTL
ncbi:probable sphingosine-1-phosphate phosphatase [Hydractinia symbiolongicarpus]|uniref:probable sphingosine-1-phosphate phosphatase n=1 Tax=Hydractinia symbiolongicarpus TaxID=13093 RepID=UPI00254EB041|nr:probable sphingosine-1-phosphate phosphatase [Hydractinia symbiolongicarpus]